MQTGKKQVPAEYMTADGIKLGVWINNQRMLYRAGKLEERRANMLAEIGALSTDRKKADSCRIVTQRVTGNRAANLSVGP